MSATDKQLLKISAHGQGASMNGASLVNRMNFALRHSTRCVALEHVVGQLDSR